MNNVRRIQTGEGSLYKEIRLAALRDAPGAFSTKLSDALLRSEESWQLQADQGASGTERAIFLAYQNGPAGLAALYRHESRDHATELLQMWVAPECRSTGLASELLDYALQWATACGYCSVIAEVMADNFRAIRFYEKCGFVQDTADTPHSASSILLTFQSAPPGR